MQKLIFFLHPGEPPIIIMKPDDNIFRPGKALEVVCIIQSLLPVFNSSLFFSPKPSLTSKKRLKTLFWSHAFSKSFIFSGNEAELYLNSSFSNLNHTSILRHSITTSPETEGSYSCESSNIGKRFITK